MIRLLLEPVNLLILDEPTNHLDMKTKDILKQAIKDFNGTVIVVSHDREFLDGLVEKVYEFGGGQVRECLGGIYEFLEKKNSHHSPSSNATPSAPSPTKLRQLPSPKKPIPPVMCRHQPPQLCASSATPNSANTKSSSAKPAKSRRSRSRNLAP